MADPSAAEIVWVSCPQRTSPVNPCSCRYSTCVRAGLAEYQDIIEHETVIHRGTIKRRGGCTCGWLAPYWRYGGDAGWQAIADADEHHNAVT